MSHSTRHTKQQQLQKSFSQRAHSANTSDFFSLLTDSDMLDVIENYLPKYRERQFPPMVTLAMFLRQVMSADGSCQHAVNELNVDRALQDLPGLSASTGGYCTARKRLPLQVVQGLAQHSGKRIAACCPKGWLWKGRHIKLVDGTTISMPDTEDNQKHYPQHGQQEEGAGFPLARLVAVISLSAGSVLHAAIGSFKGKGTGEHALLRRIVDTFEPGDLVLADAYYCSYFLIADLNRRGVDVVFEQHGSRKTDFRRGRKLGCRDHIVTLNKPARPSWMSKEEYQNYPNHMDVREAKVDKKILVTTLVNENATPKNSLGDLFIKRWNVELDLRNIKTTLGMDSLSCKTAEMCEKEMWVYFLAYNLIRLLMAESALRKGLMPRELSFKHTVQTWLAWSCRQRLLSGNTSIENTRLFDLIARVTVGKRPNRIEPRAVKKRPKPYSRLKVSRQKERERIKKNGHGEKLAA